MASLVCVVLWIFAIVDAGISAEFLLPFCLYCDFGTLNSEVEWLDRVDDLVKPLLVRPLHHTYIFPGTMRSPYVCTVSESHSQNENHRKAMPCITQHATSTWNDT